MATMKLMNLSKQFGNSVAVNHVNLDIADGELIALLGPSGCGKTTTLRMLAGFIAPDAGQILVDDRVISSPKRSIPPEKRNMSMIFQSYAIWPHKTVFENVAFGLQLRCVEKRELQFRVQQALEITHLDRLADRYPSQLSGGQQQRVALARAIVIEPQILLLDEPLSNLDASLREEMRSEIRRIHNEIGLTTVYVTHDQAEALVLADRIVVMAEGDIQQVGTPEEIYEHPETQFVAQFMGRCNVLSGILITSNYVDIDGVQFKAKEQVDGIQVGESVALSIRPYAIEIQPIDIGQDNGLNCFSGLIEQAAYLGECREYKVRLHKTDLCLTVMTPPQYRYQIGDRVVVKIPPQSCRIIPQNASKPIFVKKAELLMPSGAKT
jgi:iron(III) transport system ATP-binding protein